MLGMEDELIRRVGGECKRGHRITKFSDVYFVVDGSWVPKFYGFDLSVEVKCRQCKGIVLGDDDGNHELMGELVARFRRSQDMGQDFHIVSAEEAVT